MRKKSVDNGGAFGLLLTDLSKALDCFSHELLIAKLDPYGFDERSLILIHCNFSNCKQRVKFAVFSVLGVRFYLRVPQGLILEPLLFNTFTCDMFYSIVDFEIENYGDDSTAFSVKLGGRSVVDDLEISSSILFTWLKTNYMKANTDKNHCLLSNKNNLTVNIDENVLESEDNQVLVGITINSNLSFNKHIKNFCKKASAKLSALASILGYMNFPKCRIILNLFIISKFRCYPLTWMFHSRTLNNKSNFIFERALRITCNDRKSSF